jgi:hypothetical protein
MNAEGIILKLTLYVKNKELEDRFLRIISLVPETESVNVCDSIHRLSLMLKQPLSKGGILVLVCAQSSELLELLPYRNRFCEHQTILILPSQNSESSIAGFDLNARVVLYPEDAASYLAEILGRLIQRFGKMRSGLLASHG